MKESLKVPPPVVREIAKRRLASNKLSKLPSMARPCLSKEKVIDMSRPGFCGKKAPPLQVYCQAKCKQNHKNLVLPDIQSIKNPFSGVPTRELFFYREKIKPKAKQSNFDIGTLKTVTDNIHCEYFTIVDGRPIRPNHDVKVYLKHLRDILLLRADAAYLNDQTLKIDTLYSTYEREEYEKILEMYEKTVLNFRKYLCHSLETAQSALLKQREVEEKIKVKNAELEQYKFEYGRWRSLVLVLIEKFDVLQKYKTFLDQCPPIWWRLQNKVGFTGPSTAFKTFFLDSDVSLSHASENDEFQLKEFESDEMMFERPKVVLVKDTTCLLYFKEPEQMMNLLEDMAYYSFRYIQVGIDNSMTMKPISEYRNRFMSELTLETQNMEYEIKKFADHIKYLEEKVDYFKNKFLKILNNDFKYTVCSYNCLKLFVCVQYVNTETLGTVTDPKDTLSMLMLQIERKYEQLMFALDSLDYKIVKSIISQCMQEDREMMKRAYDAQRALREWAAFEKSLRASFDPPRYKYKRSL